MELIKAKNDRYEEYEQLLLKRDAYKKEAGACLTIYIAKFGELINKVFMKKIDCISKKKSIAFCQMAKNRGEMVNLDNLQTFLNETMREYNEQLKAMQEDYENCKNSKVSTEYVVIQVKNIYHKVAKMIHPDIVPELHDNEKIKDLWQKLVDAYAHNDLTEIQSVEVMVHKVFKDENIDIEDLKIPNIDERIEQVKEEIETITHTDPYLYKFLIEDEKAIETKIAELNEEYETYVKYEEELTEILKQYLQGGVTLTWQEN